MADGMQEYLTRNMFLRDVESPTDTRALMGGGQQYGGSPQQAQQMMGSPGVAHQLGQFGLESRPDLVRQSPFFPNQFMQQHPQFGGHLTGMLANMAATPQAQPIQGFGAGMQQAAQGMMGGPELLRHYQLQQLLAPMGAMGMMMPGAEFERKQQLMDLLRQQSEAQQNLQEQKLGMQGQKQEQEHQYKMGSLQEKQQQQEMQKPYAPPGAPGYFTPTPGHSGLQETPGAGAGMMSPGMFGNIPAQAPGWQEHPWDTKQVAGMAEAKETKATKNEKGARAAKDRAAAGLSGARATDIQQNPGTGRGRGGRGGGADQSYRQPEAYNKLENQRLARQQTIQAAKDIDPKTKAQMLQDNENTFQTEKSNLDKKYNPQGQQTTDLPRPGANPLVNPGAGAQGAPNAGASAQPAPPSPQTHGFSKSAWATKHPGEDVNAAAAAAQAAGFPVTD